MKIAIVGAGFSGLACAWNFLQRPDTTVHLFDASSIGAGASGIPSGLLHGYAGPKATLSWQAEAAYPEAIKLLQIASSASCSPVFSKSGIFRPQIAGMQFSKEGLPPDLEWWNEGECQKQIPELIAHPGLFISSGITVNCPAYLNGLWKACAARGAILKLATITHANELSGYDQIIFTVGAGQASVQSLQAPQVSLIKGQTLELDWQGRAPLPFAINAGVQFSQVASSSVYAGATYERRWSVEGIDAACEPELRAKLALFSPTCSRLPLKSIWARFRAATNDKKPFIHHQAPNIWCLGGMGSKGLLYHAWMAKKLILLVEGFHALPVD